MNVRRLLAFGQIRRFWRVVLVIFAAGICTLGGIVSERADAQVGERTGRVDQYGGYKDIPARKGARRVFGLEKINERWVFVTPAGNVFWLRSVYALSPYDGGTRYQQALGAKYAGHDWAGIYAQQVRRLKAWGFNALDYADIRALPMYNPEKLPFIWTIQGSLYGFWDSGNGASLYVGIDPGITDVYRGNFPDVFSPRWASSVEALLVYQRTNDVLKDVSPTYPWLLGFGTDDGDFTTGFGPGPEAGPSQGKTHPHLGWVAAVTAPAQTRPWTTPRGTTLTLKDPTIYTKYAWRDFLRAKYGTIAALNAAWGSSYTTWDSDGGWPSGRGILDESGRTAWGAGRDFDGTDASRTARPALWADLDAFLEQMADRYFAAYKAARDKYYPNHLLFTSAPMQAGTRVPVLRATGRYVDAIQSGGVPGGPSYPWYRRACDVAGKPLFLWTTFTAQMDANLLPGFSPDGWGNGSYNWPTQDERGQAYARDLQGLLNLRASDGTACIVGIDWWEWTDKTTAGENMNFGLVSNLDNAYDSREARIALGADRWGYPTGGEARNYRNFLIGVTKANDEVFTVLRSELAASAK